MATAAIVAIAPVAIAARVPVATAARAPAATVAAPGGDRGARPAATAPRPRADRGPRPGGDRGPRPVATAAALPGAARAAAAPEGQAAQAAAARTATPCWPSCPRRSVPSPSGRCRAASPPCARPSTSRTPACSAEGKEEIPAAGLLAIAEQLLPKLRVAEWLDRADAAMADLDELDLRDLRSVVAAGEDPMVARDETTREIAAELKEALVTKQEKELTLWFGDIDAAIGVGRVVRALKLSSQPPKAGVRFPAELAAKLADGGHRQPHRRRAARPLGRRARGRRLQPGPQPGAAHRRSPRQVNDELLATVKRARLAAAADRRAVRRRGRCEGAQPKPLRPTAPRRSPAGQEGRAPSRRRRRPRHPPSPPPTRRAAEAVAAGVEAAVAEAASSSVAVEPPASRRPSRPPTAVETAGRAEPPSRPPPSSRGRRGRASRRG